MKFEKAYLQEVSPKPTPTQPQAQGAKFEVQLNPATLRYQMASTVDFGKDAGRQKTTYQGSTSTLSFDLVFDTADEGSTDHPVDVRARTRQLERFVLPDMTQPKAAPPRLQFTYGTFTVIGVMTALNQDFDLFSANGVPLRAKCAVTIKEQKPEFDASRAGPGANTGAGATPPVRPRAGAGTATPGAAGTSLPAPPPAGAIPAAPADRTGSALAGESAADFAQRMGLDPRAWKGLQGITDPLRLQAGQQIDFSSALSSAAGIGVAAGATADAGAAPAGAASPGTAGAVAAASGAVPAQLAVDGPDLTAAGGLARALDRTAAATAGTAASVTRQAFAAAPGSAGPAAAPATAPASSPGAASAGPSAAAAVSTADPRALGYGFGIPLRPRLGVTGPITAGLIRELRGNVASGGDQPPQTSDPTVPGWLALSAAADPAAPAAGGSSGCGCACGGAS